MSRRAALVGALAVVGLGVTGAVAVALASDGGQGPTTPGVERAVTEADLRAELEAAAAPSGTTPTERGAGRVTTGGGPATTSPAPPASTEAPVPTPAPPVSVAPVSGPAPDPATCPATGRAAVVDREHQRTWLCEAGAIVRLMPMTSAVSQPDPGEYAVYAKDMTSSSTFTGGYSTMTHFVAFTYGKYEGARIAFHSVPKYADGSWVQPLDSVGSPERWGESAGCLRVLPDDAQAIWDWLSIGDPVVVVT